MSDPEVGDASARDIAKRLNNMFQVVLSAAGQLKDEWPNERCPRELDDIQEAARRGAAITRELPGLAAGE